MECRCEHPPENTAALSLVDGDPDFYLDGSKRSRVYWKSAKHFEEKGWSPWVLAYAYIGHNEIVLNEGRAGWIDYDVLAHEYGHNLGYEHIKGTVMNPSIGGMDDGMNGAPLTDTSRNVFAKFGGATVFDWDGASAIKHLGTVSSHYTRGHTSMRTLGYAGSRYARGNGSDAFYTGYWDEFADHDGVRKKNINKGQFYG